MDAISTCSEHHDYEIVILKEGYAFTNKNGDMKASGTITLLKGTHNIIVDTGAPNDKSHVISGLETNGLKCTDIDYVIGTHGHSDHIGNLNLFPAATCIVSHDICKGDLYFDHTFDSKNVKETAYKIDDSVSVISTPGHTCSDVSVVVQNTKYGTVVAAGDIFERKEDLHDESIWKENSNDTEEQQASRKTILDIADYIVPGHGPMFKVAAVV